MPVLCVLSNYFEISLSFQTARCLVLRVYVVSGDMIRASVPNSYKQLFCGEHSFAFRRDELSPRVLLGREREIMAMCCCNELHPATITEKSENTTCDCYRPMYRTTRLTSAL